MEPEGSLPYSQVIKNKLQITKQFMIIIAPTRFGTRMPPSGSLGAQKPASLTLEFRYQSP
jgi:hypothetical protein